METNGIGIYFKKLELFIAQPPIHCAAIAHVYIPQN